MDMTEVDMKETLITLTSDIVAAHVSNNNVDVESVPSLISNVYSALSTLGRVAGVKEERPEPAVTVRASVKKDHIVCLDCGKRMKMLKRHLSTEHGITPDEYRARWELGPEYPMVAPNYAETRRKLAKEIGLGRMPGQKRARRKKTA